MIICFFIDVDITIFVTEFRMDFPFAIVERNLYVCAVARVNRADIMFAA